MKLIVVAAGKGERLLPLTKELPKPLVDLGDGSCTLERLIQGTLRAKYIEKIVVVTGYLAEKIEERVEDYRTKIDIETVYNPFYDIANNIISLWSSRHLLMHEDFMISNGDNIYDDSIWHKTSSVGDGIWLTISKKNHYDDDDMKVRLHRNGHILKVHKIMDADLIDAESVGLVIVKGEKYRKRFIEKLLDLVKEKKYFQDYFVWIPNYLTNDEIPVMPLEVGDSEWREFDFIEDLKQLTLDESSFRVLDEGSVNPSPLGN